jgi:hypothetical protein
MQRSRFLLSPGSTRRSYAAVASILVTVFLAFLATLWHYDIEA